jgi:alpha-ketoglutaric semialdehyde dehydrogenase
MVDGRPGELFIRDYSMKDIQNYINGEWVPAKNGGTFANMNPHTAEEICRVSCSDAADVADAVRTAKAAFPGWMAKTVVERGDLMRAVAVRMQERKEEIAAVVAEESGKVFDHAMGETQAAIEMGFFIAGEGRRYYGKTMEATMANRQVLTVRQPLGVAALIIASNTPIANVAWKAFPSMFCGNVSLMKPSEDTPGTAAIFAEICQEAGIPAGVFNVIQGLGKEVGPALAASPDIDLVSFTGGHKTGVVIQKTAGERLAKVCLELGGKNALVVCDDADLELATKWIIASAFSNAGQRCAAASRILAFSGIYEELRRRVLAEMAKLKLGVSPGDDLGPVINERQLTQMLAAVERAVKAGAVISAGGKRMQGSAGFYMEPTLIENAEQDAEISLEEFFGPITCLYRVESLEEAIDLANHSQFGLTASIHTASLHRSMEFSRRVRTGVVVVNGGTHGSEPHMGFGGLKNSGTGWREAGMEALDVYSDWKYINLIHNPGKC